MEYYEAISIWISFIYPDLGHFPWYIFVRKANNREILGSIIFLKKEKREEMFLFVGA